MDIYKIFKIEYNYIILFILIGILIGLITSYIIFITSDVYVFHLKRTTENPIYLNKYLADKLNELYVENYPNEYSGCLIGTDNYYFDIKNIVIGNKDTVRGRICVGYVSSIHSHPKTLGEFFNFDLIVPYYFPLGKCCYPSGSDMIYFGYSYCNGVKINLIQCDVNKFKAYDATGVIHNVYIVEGE